MIRPIAAADTDAVVDIWLRASLRAHDFVPAEFWHQRVGDLRDTYLPAAESYVYEAAGIVLGFLSLLDNTVAALFVRPESQGHGVGSRLLDHAKGLTSELTLTVYKANERSVAFYEQHGFVTQQEQLDPHTGQPELLMVWSR